MVETPACSLILLVEDTEHDFVDSFHALHLKLADLDYTHELILAVNGPTKFARKCMQRWPVDAPQVEVFEFARKVPSAVCLKTIIPGCHGEILTICGPYQQLDYSGFDLIIREVVDGQVDLALPWRKGRVDPRINQLQSWFFNWLVRKMTGMPFHDLSCLVRVVRKSVMEETPLYGDLYRYLPLLAIKRGFKVKEYPVVHHLEMGKVGFLGIREYVSRLVDLLGIHFIFSFTRKPLRYFGSRGLTVFLAGVSCMLAAVVFRFMDNAGLGDSSLFMSGLLLSVAGSSICGIGLLGEILSFTLGRQRKDYIVEKILESRID